MPPKRVGGFMRLARDIVDANPGLTAQEIYARADAIATQKGIRLSAARSAQGSLVATLHKHYTDYGLERKQRGRQFHYYLKGAAEGHGLPKASHASETGGCCLDLPEEDNRRLDALISLGRFKDKQEAQRELVALGLQSLLAKLTS